ncbi:MAG: ABC transporter permease, partial [Microcoleus sp. SIO2G3]|nr:ABC transporter permease [Microcoleus sp. SIO2G3]
MSQTLEPIDSQLNDDRPRMLPPTVFWRIADDIPRRFAIVLVVLSIIVPLILWAIVAQSGVVQPLFLPTPTAVLSAFGRMWGDGTLPKDIGF